MLRQQHVGHDTPSVRSGKKLAVDCRVRPPKRDTERSVRKAFYNTRTHPRARSEAGRAGTLWVR
jgi:hypothetical protein